MPPPRTRIRVDSSRFDRKIRRFRRDLKNPTLPYQQASRELTKYIHGTIRRQGRKRPYAPLAASTRLKTGKRKALLGIIPLIVPEHGKTFAGVKFLRRSQKWNLHMHHRGYRIPAVSGKFMSFATVRGRRITFTRRKASKVPGREIIPTAREVLVVTRPIFKNWVDRMAARWERG